jgi:enoyl-[acyl-carrier protein] reductase II
MELDQGIINRNEAQLRVEEFWMGALQRAVMDGDISRGSLMAGQSVGLVDRIMPIKEIILELVGEIEAELERVRNILEI